MDPNTLISIIIPCYNAEKYITETINSVLNQNYKNIEVIIIDDGSTDSSKIKVKGFKEHNIIYIYQDNRGVSSARNNGLIFSKGKYIMFLDADDLLSTNFLMKRLNYLESNPDCGACASSIEIINDNSKKLNKTFKNVCKIEDLTSFNPITYTCPSGYLFRNETLKENNLRFNLQLSSSADKLFLYEFLMFSSIALVKNSPLLYRVYQTSMSNNLSENLIKDHISYLRLIINKKLIPAEKRTCVIARINYTIGASYLKLRKRRKALYYLLKSVLRSPKTFFNLAKVL